MEDLVRETTVPQTNVNGELIELGKSLMNAARGGDVATVVQLMRFGAPFATDWLGMTALHHAAFRGHRHMVEILMRAGIAKEPRSKVDKTPLHLACQQGHTDVVRYLISNGADLDAVDMIQMTPLHWAVQMNHIEVVHILLFNGANPNALNKFEKNCFDIADSIKNEKMLLLLNESKNIYRGTRLKMQSPVDPAKKKHYLKTSPKQTKTMLKKSLEKDVENEEVWQYLEDHGIEMLEDEDVNMVASALGSGQSVYVTEAGKQALHLTESPKKAVVNSIDLVNLAELEPAVQIVTGKRTVSPDSDSWDLFLRLNAKYNTARKSAKRYRALYLRQKQAAFLFKQKLAEVFKTIKSVDKLDIGLQCDDDDDDEEDDDEALEEEDEPEEFDEDLEMT